MQEPLNSAGRGLARGRHALPAFVAGLMLALAMMAPMAAQAQQIAIIRDAEIERMILDFAKPLLKAAGVRKTNPRVLIINDQRFNAFVTEDGTIHVNYGTIISAKTPNELKAVLAHEIGHLAGGHLARIREQAEIAAKVQAFSIVLGMGAAAAGAAAGVEQMGSMASAFILATQSATSSNLMAFRQSEESTADAAAIKYLEASGQSAKGMADVLKFLEADESTISRAMAYMRTHPAASDRVRQVETAARRGAHYGRADPKADVVRLDMVQAKLTGFLERQEVVLRRYPNSDKSVPARYARIIAAYKSGAGISAIPQMLELAKANPRNAYLQELLGQMYFETGQAPKALAPLKLAIGLAPDEPGIRALYGQALVDAGGAANLEEAVMQLARATNDGELGPMAYGFLSRAYEGLGRHGEASLAAAEAAIARGDLGTALGLARKAQQNLKPGTPAYLRADDILHLN